MAYYNPPKENNWGSILQTAGIGLTAAGGITTAATGFTGVGLIAGGAISAVGAGLSGVGSIMGNKYQQSLDAYNRRYEKTVNGENKLQASINNIRSMTGLK